VITLSACGYAAQMIAFKQKH